MCSVDLASRLRLAPHANVTSEAARISIRQERYYASLASEANTKSLPPVLTKIREESSVRFLHNLQHYRQDVYKIIDDDTYEVISDGRRQLLC
ncbi:unnamed protein product, partial [Iphiclides podalirius]